MLTSPTTLLLLVYIVGLRAQDTSVDIEIDINLENIPDPCAKHKCQVGERCESVITTQLLGLLPVAHCIPVSDKQGPCKDNQITANILSCKTEKEWSNIGESQCRLRNSGVLTKSKPMYVCPRQRSPQPEYMMLMFTCCTTDQTPSPEPSAKPSPPSPPKDSNQGSAYTSHDTGSLNAVSPNSPEEPFNKQPNMIYLIPMTLGAVVLFVLIALILGVWQRYRSTRRHTKPTLVFTTSFVNPSADHQPPEQDWAVNPLDTTDKSLLIVNEHPRK